MRIPRFIEYGLFGRTNFHDDTAQPAGCLKNYPVPYHRQRHANMCGDACVLMLAEYYGWTEIASRINLKKNPRGITGDLKLEASDYSSYFNEIKDLRKPASKSDLVEKLQEHPLMVCGDFCQMGVLGTQGHWVLLKGMSKTHFYLHDPWHGANREMEHEVFVVKMDAAYAAKPSKRNTHDVLFRIAKSAMANVG
jgi:hypothetical protein